MREEIRHQICSPLTGHNLITNIFALQGSFSSWVWWCTTQKSFYHLSALAWFTACSPWALSHTKIATLIAVCGTNTMNIQAHSARIITGHLKIVGLFWAFSRQWTLIFEEILTIPQDMEHRITRECSAISSDQIQRAMFSAQNHFTPCIKVHHFEHMIKP